MYRTIKNAFVLLLLLFAANIFIVQSFAAPTDNIILFRKPGREFVAVSQFIKKKIGRSYNLIEVEYETLTLAEFTSHMDKEKPKLMILMDNRAVRMGMDFNKSKGSGHKVPGLALMGINLPVIVRGDEMMTAISYEIPGTVLISNFKQLIKQPLKKVLAFYRKSEFEESIVKTRDILKREGIVLHAIDVEVGGSNNLESTLKSSLKKEALSGDYDLIWILLDSKLLTSDLINTAWLPTAAKSTIPFISDIKKFVEPSFNLCVYSITPNLKEMATQAYQMVSFILDDHIAPKDIGVGELVSVEQYLNKTKSNALKLQLVDEKLDGINLLE